jgi:hypothetical protein
MNDSPKYEALVVMQTCSVYLIFFFSFRRGLSGFDFQIFGKKSNIGMQSTSFQDFGQDTTRGFDNPLYDNPLKVSISKANFLNTK